MLTTGTRPAAPVFPLAMFEASHDIAPASDAEIALHEVSEDGVSWRPFDPKRDGGQNLHKRIHFAPPPANDQ